MTVSPSEGRAPWRQWASMFWDWISDYPTFSFPAGLFLVSVIFGDGNPFVLAPLCVLVAALLWWGLKGWEAERRVRRRFTRRWKGSPERAGLAQKLGLVNNEKEIPLLEKYEIGKEITTFTFYTVPNVTVEEFKKAAPAFSDAVKGHRANVSLVRPGLVEIKVITHDSLMDAREADWVKNVQVEKPAETDFLGVQELPWFAREEEL